MRRAAGRKTGAAIIVLGLSLGLPMLSWLGSPAPAARASTPRPPGAPAGSARPATEALAGPAAGPARTVQGPRMWDPARNRDFSSPSYVTVSPTVELTNQVIEVTWRGFTPSSQELYDPGATDYPVMVAECKGTHPTWWSQCFGADNGGVAGSFSPFGPMNTVYSTTAGNGTGEAAIQLLTAEEDQQLGCNVGVPCSLVIVPSQGGNTLESPPDCSDHSQDAEQTDLGEFAFSSQTGSCSWAKRIIVPLSFAPTPTDCPVANADFTAIGSPMLARAMSQWQSGLCSAADPLTIQYDSAQSEPLARTDFLAGLDDVAFTMLPADATGKYRYTYAPVAISAESIAYWIDNPVTGEPLTHLKLDARLVAKLLTQSYDFDNEGCGHGSVPPGVGCDNAVDNDPVSLFADPEFEQLNPRVAAVGDGYQVPTVLSGESDMTWELTRWMAASPAAKGFIDGSFDPWGEHVNTDYLNLSIPTDSLVSMDPYPLIAHRYSPVFPLSSVAQYQADSWYPATDWQLDPSGNYDKLSPEVPGERALFAILDEADAAAYELPVAALQNDTGHYVAPTDASMAAAVSDLATDSNHITQDVPETSKVPDSYPLTMVIYAMVPTGGISRAKAARIAQFLDYVAGAGQQPGDQPGQLAPGSLPLTAKMRAETLAAARAVADQTGDVAKKPSPAAVAAPLTPTARPSPTPTPAPSPSRTRVSLGYVSNPASSGLARYALPVLLITGCVLALGSSSALAIGRGSTAVTARLRRLRRTRA